jgi:prevent-host-death family protein
MHTWPVQNAKARLSELLEACITEGPQLVTKRGTETAVLIPIELWRKLQTTAKPSLKELLLSDADRADLILPARGQKNADLCKRWSNLCTC